MRYGYLWNLEVIKLKTITLLSPTTVTRAILLIDLEYFLKLHLEDSIHQCGKILVIKIPHHLTASSVHVFDSNSSNKFSHGYD